MWLGKCCEKETVALLERTQDGCVDGGMGYGSCNWEALDFFVLIFRISLLSRSFFRIFLMPRHYIVYIVWLDGGATGSALEVHSWCNRQLLFLAGRGDWAMLHIEGVSQTRIRIGKNEEQRSKGARSNVQRGKWAGGGNVFNLTLAMSNPLRKEKLKNTGQQVGKTMGVGQL